MYGNETTLTIYDTDEGYDKDQGWSGTMSFRLFTSRVIRVNLGSLFIYINQSLLRWTDVEM